MVDRAVATGGRACAPWFHELIKLKLPNFLHDRWLREWRAAFGIGAPQDGKKSADLPSTGAAPRNHDADDIPNPRGER